MFMKNLRHRNNRLSNFNSLRNHAESNSIKDFEPQAAAESQSSVRLAYVIRVDASL